MSTVPTDNQILLAQALRLAEIHASPTNPRKTFPEAEQAELVESVKRHGVMQPILVRPWPAAYAFEGERPQYELIAGERRYRAAKAAGLEFISATVRDLDDHETLELQIVENLHRKDLNELEEAEGYELMIKQYGYSAEQLAEKIDKSKAYIYARLKLTAAGQAARTAFREGQLDASRLLLVARIPTAALQEKALGELLQREYLSTYRAAAQHVQTHYMLKLAQAPFARGDAELVPAAGKCHPCPKRTGSHPELYPDVKSADICTDPECYAAKKAAHFDRLKSEAKAQGKAVIDGTAAEKLLRHGDWNIVGFHKLDAPCYDVPFDDEKKAYPTFRELLAEQSAPITLIEKADGTLLETVAQSDFKAIAAEVGAKVKDDSNNPDKERAATEKAENAFRRRLFDQVRSAYAEAFTEDGAALDVEDLRLIARQFLACVWHENQKRLAVMWAPSVEKIDAHEQIRAMTQQLDTMTLPELSRFLIDLALIGMAHVGGYGQTETPAPFLDAATRMRLAPDAIRRELKAEQEVKAKGKAGKGAKAPFKSAAIGDYVEVVAYPSNAELIGSIGQVASVGTSIATGKAIYTLTLADGWTLNAEAAELATSTAEAFATQQDQRNPAGEPEAAEVQPETANSVPDFQTGDRIRIKPDSDLTDAGKAGHFHTYDSEAGEALVSIDDQPAMLRCYPDELELLPAEKTQPATRKTTSKVEILYQHPDNVGLTWTGRGRKPKWVEHWLESSTLEQLLAKKRPAHKPKGGKAAATSAACEISTPRCDKTLELPGLPSPDSQPSA